MPRPNPRSITARLLAVAAVGVLLMVVQSTLLLRQAESTVREGAFNDARLLARIAAGEVTGSGDIGSFFEGELGAPATVCAALEQFIGDWTIEVADPSGEVVCRLGDVDLLAELTSRIDPAAADSEGGYQFIDAPSGPQLVTVSSTERARFVYPAQVDFLRPGSLLAERDDLSIILLFGDRLIADWHGDDQRATLGTPLTDTDLPDNLGSGPSEGDDLDGTTRLFAPERAGPFTVVGGLDRSSALAPSESARRSALLQAALGAAALMVVMFVASRSIVSPVSRLARLLERGGHDAEPVELPEEGPTEISAFARRFNEYGREVRSAAERLEHLAHHDAITGLPNRLELTEVLEARLREGLPTGLVALQLDGLSSVSRDHGRAAAIELTSRHADRLRRLVPDGLVTQIAPDRYVLMIDAREIADLRGRADRARRELTTAVRIDDLEVELGAWVGIALADGNSSVESLIADVEGAIEVAVTEHLAIVEFDESRRAAVVERAELLNDLRDAVRSGQVQVAFQAITSYHEQRVIAVEALARWEHPVQGWISPATFIPLAERAGLIGDLGEAVLVHSCRQVASWHQELGAMTPSLSVNISPHQLTRDLPERLGAILRQTHLPARLLTIEVTESAFIDDLETHAARLDVLRAMGIRVALDDFGTGWSSLSWLASLPTDTVKLDRAFLADITEDPRVRSLVGATIDLAHSVGLGVVVEGIETEEQDRLVASLGADAVQGFFHHRPSVDADAVLARIRSAAGSSQSADST